MSESGQLDTAESVASISPKTLYDSITAGEDVFILDTRAEADYDEWHIEGETVETLNKPYYELLEGIPEPLHEDLPDDRPIVVLCAKGESSRLVADHLADAGYEVAHLADGMEGWARIYEATTLTVDTEATIVQYRRPSSGCLSYLVISAGEAALIDPLREFTDRYRDDIAARDADLAYVLDTHVHADHISGLRALTRATDATAVLPRPAVDRGVDYDLPYQTVGDGDQLTVGDAVLDVVHTPGHTTGMTAYKVGPVLFTGDGLFTESVARPDLEDPDAAEGAAQTLYETLTETVLTYPADTTVAPGHFSDAATPAADGSYTATLGTLETEMAALTMAEDRFVDYIVADMPPRPANYEDIIATNLGEQRPDDEEAFALELGPNNCAASDDALTN